MLCYWSLVFHKTLVAESSVVETLAIGFGFLEGPISDKKGNIYFTDMHKNRIHIWTSENKLKTFRENSGEANGLAFLNDTTLVVCEGGNRQLTEITLEGKVTVIADQYEGKNLNSPNDLWIDPKGGIYFTDPRYGNRDNMELDGEYVFYISPDRKKITKVVDDLIRPNGVLGSPDGKLLYVADRSADTNYVYTINEDGTLSNKTFFSKEGSDGMTMDSEGNIYITSPQGEPPFHVSIYSPEGFRLEEIETPEKPGNVHFGGKDGKTLFIPARTSLYAIKMRVGGVVESWKKSPLSNDKVSTEEYTASAGVYKLTFRIRTPKKDDPRHMGLFLNGRRIDVLKTVSNNWESYLVENVSLIDGTNIIEIRDSEGVVHGDELDIDKLTIEFIRAVDGGSDSSREEKGRFLYAHKGFEEKTPLFIPHSDYQLHQIDRPQPPRVIPPESNETMGQNPPSDATVLFDGTSMEHFDDNPEWKVLEGYLVAGKEFLVTKESFGDCQLHVEWRTPNPPRIEQGLGILGNSGVVLMSLYEVQIYDSYTSKIYPDGSAAAIYGQTPPLFNACRSPGEWQTFDIFFKNPVFKGRTLLEPARITVWHNGILVQNNTEILGPTAHRKIKSYKPHADKLPLALKGENTPVEYRNIWIRELPSGIQ